MTAADSAAQTHGGLWATLPGERSSSIQTHCHLHSQANAHLYLCKAKWKEVEFFIGQLKQRFSPLCVGKGVGVWVGGGEGRVTVKVNAFKFLPPGPFRQRLVSQGEEG